MVFRLTKINGSHIDSMPWADPRSKISLEAKNPACAVHKVDVGRACVQYVAT